MIGKSYLVRDLLFHHQDIPIGTVISEQKQVINSTVIIFQNYSHEEYNSNYRKYFEKTKTVMKQINKEQANYGRSYRSEPLWRTTVYSAG